MLPLGLALVLSATALAGTRPAPVETDVVSTGEAPCGVATRGSIVWIGVYALGRVVAIDGDTGRTLRQIDVGSWACRVALDGRAAWVTRDRPGELVRVDLRSGAIRRFAVGAGAFDVAVAFGSVWVTSFEVGTVARIDPKARRLTRVYKVGPNPAGITACGDRVWIGHGRNARFLTWIDPRTHRIRRLGTGTKTPGWPRCVRSELWVTAPGRAIRMNARNGRILGRLELGGTPAEAAAGPDGLAWITDKERSLVFRVDQKRVAIVDSFPAGPGAYALARAGRAMWVTSFAGSDVRRYEP